MADRTEGGAAPAPWLRTDAPAAAPATPPPWGGPASADPAPRSGPGQGTTSWAPDGGVIGSPGPEPRRGRGLPWVLGVATAGVLAVGGYLVVDRTGSGGSGTEASEESATFGAPGSTASTSAAPLDAADGDPSPPGERSDEPQPTSPPGPLQPVAVAATCQAAPGIDAAGDPVTYEPALTLDGVPATAWRCPGSAVGARLTFDFGHEVSLASVGLVPGYAKVDPADGTNRFTENRTVTAVTWSFDDGTSFVQRIDAPRASLAVSDLPAPVSSTRVVLQVTGTGNDTALRDFTAISDVAFSGQD